MKRSSLLLSPSWLGQLVRDSATLRNADAETAAGNASATARPRHSLPSDGINPGEVKRNRQIARGGAGDVVENHLRLRLRTGLVDQNVEALLVMMLRAIVLYQCVGRGNRGRLGGNHDQEFMPAEIERE